MARPSRSVLKPWFRWAGSVESASCLSAWNSFAAFPNWFKTDLSHSCGSSVGVLKGQASSLACRLQVALRGELLPLLVAPQLKRQPWPPPTVWFSLGTTKVEWSAFSELLASHNIHFLRVTRGGRLAWGSVGTWHAFSTPNGPRLCLRSFSCCLGARLRDLTFDVDPHDPRRMIDGTGRVLYYKGNLSMQYNPHRRLRQRMMNGLCSHA